MMDKGSQRHVFISYVAKDPDWPVTTIRSLVSDVIRAGIRVEVDFWERSPNARFEPLGAWRKWMDEAVIGADQILCLVSPRYLQMWNRRFEDSADGLALQAISAISSANSDAKDGWGRLVTIRPGGLGNEAVPTELARFLSFDWDAERSRLVSFLSKNGPGYAGPMLLSPDIKNDDFMSLHADSSGSEDVLLVPDLSGSDVMDAWREEAKSRGIGGGVPTVLLTEVIGASDEIEIEVRSSSVASASASRHGLWLAEDLWRAPLGDFPPPWASAWGDDVYGLWADLTVNGATQRMRWIEPSGPEGFLMGSTKKERDAIKDKRVRDWANQHEHAPKRIEIKPGFWLADTPCTQAFWQAVTGENPSHFRKVSDAHERPVESVRWDDVDEHFVKRFAQTPEWGTDDRLCLPTEEQWEYAARAGTRSAYWWGDDWDAARGNADVTGERDWEDKEGTTPVHRYAPNPWGLYDVHGNVWEWCEDPWRERRDAPEARPDDEQRVVRGGSWFVHPGYARAAFRLGWHRGFAFQFLGFRFALRSPAGPEAR